MNPRHPARAQATVARLVPVAHDRPRSGAAAARHIQPRRAAKVPHRKRGGLHALWSALARLALAGGVVAVGLAVSLGFTTPPESEAAVAVQTTFLAAVPVWSVDLDNDGLMDLANPTLGKIRGVDRYGSGKFGARRDGGKRKHEGADFVAAAGSIVFSPLSGVVTDVGYAYEGKEKLSFVEIKDAARQLRTRVFYVDPTVSVGDLVQAGDSIGLAEALSVRYPLGITNHVHVELRDSLGAVLDPALHLPLGAPALQLAGLPGATPAPEQTLLASR